MASLLYWCGIRPQRTRHLGEFCCGRSLSSLRYMRDRLTLSLPLRGVALHLTGSCIKNQKIELGIEWIGTPGPEPVIAIGPMALLTNIRGKPAGNPSLTYLAAITGSAFFHVPQTTLQANPISSIKCGDHRRQPRARAPPAAESTRRMVASKWFAASTDEKISCGLIGAHRAEFGIAAHSLSCI